MQKLVLWLFPAIFVGVVIFLVVFLVQVNQADSSIYEEKADIPKKQEIPKIMSREKWVEHFSGHEREGFFYPVKMVYIEVDLKEKKKPQEIYRLEAGELDSYQLFCLQEVLKSYDLPYRFEQKKEEMSLVIDSQERTSLQSITTALKAYKIDAKIKKVIK